MTLISWLSDIPLYINTTTSLSIFLFHGIFKVYCSWGPCKQSSPKFWGACVLSIFGFLNIYAPEWKCRMLWSWFLDVFGNTIHFSRVAIVNLHPTHQCNKVSFSPWPVLHFWFLHFPGRPFWRMRSETSLQCWYALPACLVGQNGRMRFFLNIFRKKRIRPFWPTASLSKFCCFSCALKASPIYLLKTVSCNSALLSNPLRCFTWIYFWTIVIIYNPAGLWIAVPLSSIFQPVFLGAGHKTAGLLQDLFWFRGAVWAFGLFFFLSGD